MSEQRLSKLQKWILTTCYKVTVLLDNSDLIPLENKKERDCNCPLNKNNPLEDKSIILIEKDIYGCIKQNCMKHEMKAGCSYFDFSKEDILCSFFGLEKSYISASYKMQKFKDNAQYHKAHVSVTRTLQSLSKNDYIGVYGGGSFTTRIKLTDKGATKAAELLKLEYTSPPQETEAEYKSRQAEMDRRIRLIELQLR